MAIQTLSDLHAAYDAGRFHVQRFQKNGGTAHTTQWADPTFASGQPAYDAHVGTPLVFTPAVAQRNDSIYIPPVGAGMQRYLHTATFWSNQGTYNGPGSVFLYDLLGYYPLIDGDSTDLQEMDNTASLPRYADGAGVVAVLVNHVAPAVQNGLATVVLTGADDVQRTVTVNIPNAGVNLVCTGSGTTASAVAGAIAMPMGDARGIKRIDSVTYATPPGGLHCLYLIRPLGTVVLGDRLLAAEKDFFAHQGCAMPRIHDGAWLGWFDNIGAGTARSVAWFGNLTFVWN